MAVGGYDEHFVASAHCEDFDIAQRLALAGDRVVYDPEAWLIHLHAPSGGCRVNRDMPWPEWSNTGNLFLYAFRHGVRKRNFGHFFRQALRTGPGRKEVVVRPWRWPAAWWGFLRAGWYGFSRRKVILGTTGLQDYGTTRRRHDGTRKDMGV